MDYDREERAFKVEARMSWAELMDTIDAASGWVEASPRLAADAHRLERIAGYLRRISGAREDAAGAGPPPES